METYHPPKEVEEQENNSNLPEREDEWFMLVHQSWCETDKCGYRNFEVPDGWEIYKYTNDPHHQKIIDHVKKWIDGKTI